MLCCSCCSCCSPGACCKALLCRMRRRPLPTPCPAVLLPVRLPLLRLLHVRSIFREGGRQLRCGRWILNLCCQHYGQALRVKMHRAH